MLVAKPLVDCGERGGLEHAFDVVTAVLDLRPGDLVQPSAGQLREPALDQLGPVGLHRRPARGDPGLLRRPQVLPDRFAVSPKDAPTWLFERPAYQWTQISMMSTTVNVLLAIPRVR
ncbi:hypothetical protein [Streptomyces erythrochromogenes]|uniref:hypothetical protein n=1 Tax=Streptomyces erythrochromogenes TaxID=285574 RepID=UPI0033E8989F